MHGIALFDIVHIYQDGAVHGKVASCTSTRPRIAGVVKPAKQAVQFIHPYTRPGFFFTHPSSYSVLRDKRIA